MDYEREKGRIKGHRTTRKKAIEFAKLMVPHLAKAREEVSDRGGEGHSNQALANWLNARNHKTIYNAIWRSESISRLFDSHIGWLEEIEKEYATALEMRRSILANERYERREERLAELADIEAVRERDIIEIRKLSAALTGKKYVETAVPAPISPHLVRKREARPKRASQPSLFKNLPNQRKSEA